MTTYNYDGANRQTEVIDGEGNVNTTVYDRAGRTIATIATVDGEGDRTSFTYDKANRRTRLTDARNQVTTFQYDTAGRMVKQTDALGRVCTYQYDGVDNVTLKWDARNTRCTMTYDVANRLTKEDYSNADQAGVAAMNYANTFVYDDSNNQTELSDPTGTITRSFSGRNNRLWESNRDNKRVTYTYDCIENRDTMLDADSGRFTYTFDVKNRLRTTTNPKNEVTTCSYDLADRETRRDLGNGTFSTRDYDDAGRLLVLSNDRVAGAEISRFAYTYLCKGQAGSCFVERGYGFCLPFCLAG